jgi:hypothetical protein
MVELTVFGFAGIMAWAVVIAISVGYALGARHYGEEGDGWDAIGVIAPPCFSSGLSSRSRLVSRPKRSPEHETGKDRALMRRLLRDMSVAGLLFGAAGLLTVCAATGAVLVLLYSGSAFEHGEPIPLLAVVLGLLCAGSGYAGVRVGEKALNLRRRRARKPSPLSHAEPGTLSVPHRRRRYAM